MSSTEGMVVKLTIYTRIQAHCTVVLFTSQCVQLNSVVSQVKASESLTHTYKNTKEMGKQRGAVTAAGAPTMICNN